MTIEIRVERREFFRGCTAGLTERTALVELSVHGSVALNPAAEQRIRTGLSALLPTEPLYGISDSSWPSAFLHAAHRPRAGDDETLERLGEWLVAAAVAIARWSRDPVWKGRVLEAAPGRLLLAIPWYRYAVFDQALALAIQLVGGWLESGERADTTLDEMFGDTWDDIQANGLGPNTLRFIEAAVRLGMPFDVLPAFVQIGWGVNAQRFDLALTGRSSWIATALAKDKLKTGRTLAAAGIPVPNARRVVDADDAEVAAADLGWPVVVKPSDLDGALGVVPGISDRDTLRSAFEQANRLSPGNVMLEKHWAGDDHRILVAQGRSLQVARRTPPGLVGDGVHTVRQLVDDVNADPRRGTGRRSLLQVVELTPDVLACLAQQGFDPKSVPPDGAAVALNRTGNISAGGTAEDVTAIAHPDNLDLAVRAARIIGLDIAGVDFLCPDITRSWREVGGVICEVNAQPGFRPHWLADPDWDVNGEILDILFDGRPARIPTAAITGTNGKSTTAEMLHRIWTAAGRVTGVCTTARLRIGDQIVSTDNLSGQPGSRIILNDPGVGAAVLEMPRKGLIYFGHHCDRYDVAALLNIQDDHIGVDGIESLEQMAELKAEVLQRATRAVVVNAEDPLCLAMRARAGTSRHILVARTPAAPAVVTHRQMGGEAVFIDIRDGRPWIVVAAGENESALMPVHDVPATMNGVLTFNESNALFATALAWAQGIGTDAIRTALSSFENSAEQNPGRYNFIAGLPFDAMVDFAHNPDGVQGICSAAAGLPVSGRRLLCSVNVGSRHPSHVETLAQVLAETFDAFVLSCDPALVGGCPEYAGPDPAATMVDRSRRLLLQRGVGVDRITVDTDPRTAIRVALDQGRPGDLVVLLADHDMVATVLSEWPDENG